MQTKSLPLTHQGICKSGTRGFVNRVQEYMSTDFKISISQFFLKPRQTQLPIKNNTKMLDCLSSGLLKCSCYLTQGLLLELAGSWCLARPGCKLHTPAVPGHQPLPTPACCQLLLSTFLRQMCQCCVPMVAHTTYLSNYKTVQNKAECARAMTLNSPALSCIYGWANVKTPKHMGVWAPSKNRLLTFGN